MENGKNVEECTRRVDESWVSDLEHYWKSSCPERMEEEGPEGEELFDSKTRCLKLRKIPF